MAPRRVFDPETGQEWGTVKAAAEALGVSREVLHRRRLQWDDGAGRYVLLPPAKLGRKITTRFDFPDGRVVCGWKHACAAAGLDRAGLIRRLELIAPGHYRVLRTDRAHPGRGLWASKKKGAARNAD